jgi:hypothetical protein
VLAAAVPANGRVLELGTGTGVGTAWITHGLQGRADVEVVTVEIDATTAALAAQYSGPSWVGSSPVMQWKHTTAVSLLDNCSTTQMSSSQTATPTACAKPEPNEERGSPESVDTLCLRRSCLPRFFVAAM